MPGSVANCVIPVVAGNPIVFPFGLSRAFTEQRAWPARVNDYHDGTSQRGAVVASSRRTWKMTQRLAPAAMAPLRAFLLAYATDAFYFYDPKEPASGQMDGSNYDPTGASSQGRYAVRILSAEIVETIYIPRTEVEVELIEAL